MSPGPDETTRTIMRIIAAAATSTVRCTLYSAVLSMVLNLVLEFSRRRYKVPHDANLAVLVATGFNQLLTDWLLNPANPPRFPFTPSGAPHFHGQVPQGTAHLSARQELSF